MTLLAVKPEIPQPEIGHVLDALAQHRSIEFHCQESPVRPEVFEVDSRQDLEDRLAELFPFKAYLVPVDEKGRVATGITLAGGPPIRGEGDSMAAALRDFLRNALDYCDEWERSLRFGAEQKYWGWVYRILLAGDEQHIVAALLNEPVE